MDNDRSVAEGSLKTLLERYERQLIEEALAASSGNQRRAAAALGLLPTTLHEKMKRLGLLRRPSVPSLAETLHAEAAEAVPAG
jgi:DNA-binding NtrC family response regulator